MLSPITRALAQLDDPVFLSVLVQSVLLSFVAFAVLVAGSAWGVHGLLAQSAWLGWVAGIAGGLAVALLGVWLFVPVALLIATLFSNRICAAVDRRFYPGLSTPKGAPLAEQAWDGAVLGLQVLGFQLVALLLAFLLPGIGLVLGWMVTGWAIGRGLFVTVAMRRMGRPEALRLYARRRVPVLWQGGLLALLGTVPVLNLLVPVLGIAALTHVLNASNELPRGLPLLRGP